MKRGDAHHWTLCLLLVCSPCVFALNPSLDVSQYAHFAWKNSEGFAKGSIGSIAQTPDGYLWLGTSFGLVRFDGIRPVPWTPPAGESLPSGYIRTLLVGDGALWIGTEEGLSRWKNGKLTRYDEAAEGLSGDRITSLFEDREGNVWVGGDDGLDRFRELAASTITMKQGLCGEHVGAIVADRNGSVWTTTIGGLSRWTNGQLTTYRSRVAIPPPARSSGETGVREIVDDGLPPGNPESLFLDDHGRVWVATRRGIAYFEEGHSVPVRTVSNLMVHAMAQDTTGSVWINDQSEGLLHWTGSSSIDRVPWDKLRSGDVATTMVADPRQGGLWLGFFRGGVSYFQGGAIRASFTPAAGLAAGRVSDLRLDNESMEPRERHRSEAVRTASQAMTSASFPCGCATMARASIHRCAMRAGGPATTGCPACRNAPGWLAVSWPSGAHSTREPRSS